MHNIFNQTDYARTVHRIQKLREQTPALWGKMNVNQMVCHLTDPLRGVLKQRSYPNNSNIIFRTFVKWFILYAPVSWPRKLPTTPGFDQFVSGTSPTTFQNDMHLLLEALQNFYGLPNDYDFPNHPAFGKLSKREWGRLTWLHIDHHLLQFKIYR